MSEYRYSAYSSESEPVKGTIRAEDAREAVVTLKAEGLTVLRVEPLATKEGRKRRRISSRDLPDILEGLSSMLQAGIRLPRALDILAEERSGSASGQTLAELRERIVEGSGLGVALREAETGLPEYVVRAIEAGEAGSGLPEVLARMAALERRKRELREALWSAVTYPLILLAGSILTACVMFFYVLPRLSGLFEELGGSLPWPTRVALLLSGAFSQTTGKTVGAAALAVTAGSLIALRWRAPRRWVIRLPLIGRIVRQWLEVSFFATMSTLLRQGMNAKEALDLLSMDWRRRALGDVAKRLQAAVAEGTKLSAAFGQAGLFDRRAVEMLRIGEETGTLAVQTERYSLMLEHDLNASLRFLIRVLEPALILVIGALVAFLAMAMILPVFYLDVMAGG